MTPYQTVVLSGGGAKGPYSLGVLLALDKFHRERGRSITSIYCGTLIGALNSTLAAQGNLKQLTSLYGSLSTKYVLGTSDSRVGYLGMLKALARRPFHYFTNTALKSTIECHAKFDQLRHDAHLVICATNYTTGQLESFYRSDLIDEFLAEDRQHPPENQRLLNYHRIESQEQLVQALLASTAVPFYLPPVEIRGSLYVDGGVGNNTPLRQAAYICRFLNRGQNVRLEPTICVINDPTRFKIESDEASDVFGVIRRTLDIFHNALVSDSQLSWDRINREVQSAAEKQNLLQSEIDALEGVPAETRALLARRADEVLQPANAVTRRRELPILIVRPSEQLADDILCFDPKKSKRLTQRGIAECLTMLENRSLITSNDHQRWIDQIS